MKKIIILFTLGLCLPVLVFAAARQPVNLPPLQPLPDNTAPNTSTNINTPGNAFDTSQSQIQEQQDQATQSDTPEQDSNKSSKTSVPSGSDPTFYWFLIFVGIGGFVAIGLWAYYRFWHK